ncbi:MAG: hypothetical protein RL228_346 [Actinomycetota bacterium]|jgi:hypothetical protein
MGTKVTLPPITSNVNWRALLLPYSLLLLMSIVIRLAGVTDTVYPNGLATTPEALLGTLGESDAGSYLRLAFDLLDFKLDAENRWIVLLWPPGMAGINLIALSFGQGFLVVFSLISALLCSLPALAFIYSSTRVNRKTTKYLLQIAALISVINPVTLFFGTGIGMHNSDLIGLALFSSGMIMLLSSVLNASHKRNIYFLIGLATSSSLFFRWSFFPILFFIVALLLTTSFVSTSDSRFLMRAKKHFLYVTRKQALYFSSAVAIITIPWTLIEMFVLHPGNFSPAWSISDWIWGSRWLTDSDALSAGQWVYDSGGNWACVISDPVVCEHYRQLAFTQNSIYFPELRNAALSAVLSNPGGFLLERFDHLKLFWFETLGSTGAEGFWSQVIAWSAIISILATTLSLIKFGKAQVMNIAITIIPTGLVFLSLVMTHFEERYFFPIFAFALIGALFTVATYLENRPTKKTNSINKSI